MFGLTATLYDFGGLLEREQDRGLLLVSYNIIGLGTSHNVCLIHTTGGFLMDPRGWVYFTFLRR